MLKEYKAIVDKVAATIAGFKDNHEQVCEILNIDISNGYARNQVTTKFRELIKIGLTPAIGDCTINYKEYRELEEALVYEAVLYKVDNCKYLIPIRTIRDILSEFKCFDEEADWQAAIVQVKNYNLFENSTYNYDRANLRDSYPREYDVAMAAMGLIEYGCEIKFDDTSLVIDKTEKAIERLEAEIKHIGGLAVIKSVFNFLRGEGYYFDKVSRYIVVAHKNFIPSHTQRLIPFGYLLNLAVKYPFENKYFLKRQKELNKKLAEITKIAKLLSTSLNIQIYGTWAGVFQSTHSLPEYISRLALSDSGFSFPTYDITDMPSQIRSLFIWIDHERFNSKNGFSIEEYLDVLQAIIKIADRRTGIVDVYLSRLIRETILPEIKIKHILMVISHEPTGINKNYQTIADYESVDFGFKPLIKLSPTKYIMCDKSWCAVAFYEAMASMVRKAESDSDSKIGYALESFIQEEFIKHNILYHSGNYAGRAKGKGESDIIVETETAIVLIEAKKKAFTRKAKSGRDIEIIIDLAASLLEAQLQAGRTEIILREQGFLEIENNGQISKIEHKGRDIERITLAHLDYGSFQDRTVINNILSILVNTRMEILNKNNTTAIAKFEEIKQKCDEWEAQAAELVKYDESFLHFPFFNCWFLSLSQLLLILKFSNSNESFYKTLVKTKHVTFGSSNFYYEFYISNREAVNSI